MILYATWLPYDDSTPDLPKIEHLDKLIHAIMFGGFTGACLFDYRRQKPHRPFTAKVIEVVGCAALGFAFIDETVQGFLPIGRPSDRMDFYADCLGIIIAIITAPSIVGNIFKED